MKLLTKKAAVATVMAGLAAVSFAGCNRPSRRPSRGGDWSNKRSGSRQAGVHHPPDAASSSRWENGDRPQLEESFKAQGVETDIQNAQNDTSKYATIAQQQLTKGCAIMLLVD